MLHLLRPMKERLFAPLGARLTGISPNTITGLSLLPGLLAGVAWWWGGPLGLALASLFTILNGILDLLDGHLARQHGKASMVGDFLDCVVDR